jgi:hypothetical protein
MDLGLFKSQILTFNFMVKFYLHGNIILFDLRNIWEGKYIGAFLYTSFNVQT